MQASSIPAQQSAHSADLSDPRSASPSRRQMLDLVNGLKRSGVRMDTSSFPSICVIGSQGAGKSSLLESTTGCPMPRGTKTVTRCPIECHLSHYAGPWECVVYLQTFQGKDGESLDAPRLEKFGEPMYNKGEVQDRISRAQRAILNTAQDPRLYLSNDSRTRTTGTPSLSFTMNSVSLQIRGPDVEDLSFVDLPGLIANVGADGDEADIELVKDLVQSYIKRPSCIILLVVSCETDFANQGAYQLAKKCDPDGSRTIGVLTKPDRADGRENLEGQWLRLIRNEDEPLRHGWFCVKQPSLHEISEGITWQEARERERAYFRNEVPWNTLSREHQNRLGTVNLVRCVGDVLTKSLYQMLPVFQRELRRHLSSLDDELKKLPEPPAFDAASEVFNLISNYIRDVAAYVQGTPEPDGWKQLTRPWNRKFYKAVRATEPYFVPRETSSVPRFEMEGLTDLLSFLKQEGAPPDRLKDTPAIYLDEVRRKAAETVSRELPNITPWHVIPKFITGIIEQWEGPAFALHDQCLEVLEKRNFWLISQHFSAYPTLQERVSSIVADFIRQASDDTSARITWLLNTELASAQTLNETYYLNLVKGFMQHYEEALDMRGVSEGLHRAPSYHTLEGTIARGLQVEEDDPYQNCSDEPRENNSVQDNIAITVMATVSAYFHIAYKRFTDNVAMAIDYDLALGLDRKHALENAIRQGLGIGGNDSLDVCTELIQEPKEISDRREELGQVREQLRKARMELSKIWPV